jgi:predicted enzyme related to lactoylglutathione lyase
MNAVQFILYVTDQKCSKSFYQCLLRREPILDVPGMTEFQLSEMSILGFMPETGIAKLLGDQIPNPSSGNGIPRCELYLRVDDIEFEFQNALKCGARMISPPLDRDWGDRVCYFSDPDGHIIAFANKIDSENIRK